MYTAEVFDFLPPLKETNLVYNSSPRRHYNEEIIIDIEPPVSGRYLTVFTESPLYPLLLAEVIVHGECGKINSEILNR